MIIKNKTHVSEALIRAVAQDVGLDLSQAGTLEIEFIEGITSKGVSQGNYGQFFQYGDTYCVQLLPWASTETLAHELRHAYQAQAMGWNEMHEVYKIEEEIEGYEGNILEVDAKEAGKRWKV
jgi:hypothetical protein